MEDKIESFEFNYGCGDVHASASIEREAVKFGDLVEVFVQFALACGYAPETIKQYIPFK